MINKEGEIMKKQTRKNYYKKSIIFRVNEETYKNMKSKEDFNWSNYIRECIEEKLKTIEVATSK